MFGGTVGQVCAYGNCGWENLKKRFTHLLEMRMGQLCIYMQYTVPVCKHVSFKKFCWGFCEEVRFYRVCWNKQLTLSDFSCSKNGHNCLKWNFIFFTYFNINACFSIKKKKQLVSTIWYVESLLKPTIKISDEIILPKISKVIYWSFRFITKF